MSIATFWGFPVLMMHTVLLFLESRHICCDDAALSHTALHHSCVFQIGLLTTLDIISLLVRPGNVHCSCSVETVVPVTVHDSASISGII